MGERDFLTTVAEVVRNGVLGSFNADSCIATTRIVIDVLDYFGVPARPLPVETLVFNEEARDILETDGMHAVAAAVHAREPEDEGGPWTMGLGLAVKGDEVGHLVAAIPASGVILDGSLDQASRPLKHINLTASVIPVEDPEFFTTVGSVNAVTTKDDDGAVVTLVYSHSSSRVYLTSPNWKRRSAGLGDTVFRQVTGDAIREIKRRGVTPT